MIILKTFKGSVLQLYLVLRMSCSFLFFQQKLADGKTYVLLYVCVLSEK